MTALAKNVVQFANYIVCMYLECGKNILKFKMLKILRKN